jgi:hypothetical protein
VLRRIFRKESFFVQRLASPLLTVAAVLISVMLVADRMNDRRATAAEVERINVSPTKARRPVSLRDRLVVGLQARLKSEVAFVEVVVDRVQTGKIPQRIVDETFFWARQRASATQAGRSRRPIIFFMPAMRARAERLRVSLE